MANYPGFVLCDNGRFDRLNKTHYVVYLMHTEKLRHAWLSRHCERLYYRLEKCVIYSRQMKKSIKYTLVFALG